MSSIAHIRKSVFRISQAEFGAIAGTTQTSVSRWENGEMQPGLTEMALIRAEAQRRGHEWDDRWFFEAPASEQAIAS